ncbi:MAG: hypothetical protein GF401_16935 [Chitinivibrionales bacterium]|nr:hypothetical protein [Chitinivibrionales bacterium]
MASAVLNQKLLNDKDFWENKTVLLPAYERQTAPIKSLCFSAGRMAYGHTGDILQDLLNKVPESGVMVGIETYAQRYVNELASCDYLVTQLIYENEKDKVVPKIQGSLQSVLYVDSDRNALAWNRMIDLARNPEVQFATINAPEGAYGMAYHEGDEFAEPLSKTVKEDMEAGTVLSDAAKWTAFALERFKAGLNFAMVSCTNFSANGFYTKATLKTVGKAWESKGFAPQGFVDYLSDPKRFAFPNTMIDRIAVPAGEQAQQILDNLGIMSTVVVTEKARYWAIEDLFPAGRPDFETVDGVFVESDYNDVKKYEDMKLRILNMSHSVIAGLGVLLGYQGQYGIYRAMQDKDIRKLIDTIISIVLETVDAPRSMTPADFAKDTIERLNNPNIPDDPMRIALNASTKMKPRFMDTFFEGEKKGIPQEKLDCVLLPVAGYIRYALALDDQGKEYQLENDPIKDLIQSCGAQAQLGEPSSVHALKELIAHKSMGKDLYTHGETGKKIEQMVKDMLEGPGGVRKKVQEVLEMIG